MADGRCWSRELVRKFIKIYEENPCLWKIKSKEYTNRKLKYDAYDRLVDFCRPYFREEASREFVVRKIQSLRGSFRKELRKVIDSKRSGTQDVYTPSLWYFELLLFVKDQELPTANAEYNTEGDTEDLHYSDEKTGDEEELYYELQEDPFMTPAPTFSEQINRRGIKRSVEDICIEPTTSYTPPPPPLKTSSWDVSECEAVGIIVSKKLQRMDPIQALYAESLINHVLRKGLMKTLTDNTVISENSFPPGFSHSQEHPVSISKCHRTSPSPYNQGQ